MDALIGHTLGGKYTIERELGRGGMAAVFLADQPGMKRKVAIKVLPKEFTHEKNFLARFQREVETIASLTHPHILPVHDYGDEDGWTYIVMAYLDGGSLSDLIRDAGGSLPLDRISKLMTQVAAALNYAHGRGIIHRDLKPANIMLDGTGNAYLTDFGIARLTEGTGQMTGSALIGTPAYMAPEMAQPDSLTPKIDVYAFGVTLFQAVTGKLPFNAETPIGLIMAHVANPVPLLSPHRPDAPEDLQMVFNKAMAKDPTHRYDTAGELMADFQAALEGRLVWGDTHGTEQLSREDPVTAPLEMPLSDPTRGGEDVLPQRASTPTEVHDQPGGINPMLLIGGIAGLAIIVAGVLGAMFLISGNRAAQSAQATADYIVAESTRVAQAAVDAAAAAEATATAEAEAAPFATATAAAERLALAEAWPVAFFDNFASGDGNWFQEPEYLSDFADASITIEDGVYRFDLTANTDTGVVWYEPHGNTYVDDDFDLRVMSRRAEGQVNAFYGVTFRYRDNSNLYLFAVCDNGCVNVTYVENGYFNTLYEGTTDAVNAPGEFNELRVVGTGDLFTFFVNGVEVAEVTEDSIPSGGVGVYNEVFGRESAIFEHDLIELKRPSNTGDEDA